MVAMQKPATPTMMLATQMPATRRPIPAAQMPASRMTIPATQMLATPHPAVTCDAISRRLKTLQLQVHLNASP
ncbi:hypothetical protein AZE42_13363, partial [Rhizopogon vesiculosus]